MKKRFLSIVSVMLVASMMAATVTGCGSRTKATDITIDDGDTIIVDEEDLETEKNVDSDNITETEVIGGDAEETEDANTSVGAEDENIVLYDEIAEYGKYGELYTFNFEDTSAYVDTTEDVVIYNEDGVEVGYIKAGSDVSITESAVDGRWTRFENPIDGTGYDYLYVFRDFTIKSEEIILDAESMKQGIVDYINTYGFEDINYNFVSEKTSDMEVFEFNMENRYQNQVMFNYWMDDAFSDLQGPIHYETLFVECENDADGWIACKVYYKDFVDLSE